MSNKVKFLISLVVVCVVGSGSLVYYVSSRVKPEDIKKEIISVIEKNIPGSKATINELTFSLGFTSSFSIKQIEIKDFKNHPLLSSSLISVNVPIWAILTGSGIIDVKLNDPLLSLKLYENGTSNWFTSINADTKSVQTTPILKVSKKTVDSDFTVPAFIANSKINFSMRKARLNFTNIDNQSQFYIDKILFKNLSLNHTTAYEIKSKIAYKLDAKNKLKLDLQIIGEIDLREYLTLSKIQLSSLMTLKNVELGAIKIPIVKNILKLNYDKNKSTVIDNRLEVGRLLSSNFSMNISKMFDLISIKDLDTNIDLTHLDSFVHGTPKVRTGELLVSGDATLNLSTMDLKSALQVMTRKDVSMTLMGQQFTSKVKGSLSEQRFKLDLVTKLLGSSISTKLSTRVNVMDIPQDLSRLSPIFIDIESSGLQVSRKFISSLLYPETTEEKEIKESHSDKLPGNSKRIAPPLLLPPIVAKLNFKNLQLEGEALSILASVNAKKQKIKSVIVVKANNVSKGNVKVNVDTFIDAAEIHSLTAIKINDFKFINITALLPPFLSEIRGKANGSINGSITLGTGLKYSLATSLIVSEGEVKELNVNNFIKPYLENISFLKKQNVSTDFSDKFKILKFSGDLKDSVINVRNLYFVGNKDSFSLKLKGSVSMLDKQSRLIGISNIKGSGVKDIPVQLSGAGFVLIPEIKYTTDKLTENIYKSTVKNEKKKIKKAVEKGLKKEAEKLLKGFQF